MPGDAIPDLAASLVGGLVGLAPRPVTPGCEVGGPWAGTTAGQLPGGGSWPAVVEPGSAYCATTRLDLADCGPGPALLMAWTVNR